MCSDNRCSCPCHTLCAISSEEFGSDLLDCSSATWELCISWLYTLLHRRCVRANLYHLLTCLPLVCKSKYSAETGLTSTTMADVFQFTIGTADLHIIFHFSIYMPLNVGEALSIGNWCFFEWLLMSLFYFNIS